MMPGNKLWPFAFVALFLHVLVATAGTSVEQDRLFRALRNQLEGCRTEADLRARFGASTWEYEGEGGVIVHMWDWGAMCIMLGYRNACWGFSVGIDQDTGTLLWWTPQWMGTIPDDAQTVYGFKEEIPETDCGRSEGTAAVTREVP